MNYELLWIFNIARVLFIRMWRIIAELDDTQLCYDEWWKVQRNWYLFIIQQVIWCFLCILHKFSMKRIKRSVNDFFLFFSLCSTRILTICKNNVTCFKIKIYRSVILILMLKILPLSVLLYNYLQGFFHSLHLQKISINRYKIGPFQYNIIIYSVIYNLVYLSVFKI